MLYAAQLIREESPMTAAAKKRKRLATTLAAAVAHPIRIRCLVILAERAASPSQIARQLDADVSMVGYHVNALAEANLIEEVGNRPVRGAVEHFYRATQLLLVSDEEETELTPAQRITLAETVVSLYAANAAHAIEAGTLLARDDHHLARTAMNVDEQGWSELAAAYTELYERVAEIQTEAAERMGESDEEPVRVLSFQSLFELPKPY
jgi:DNA-binding transcriptional ArsR family regulator